MSSQSNQPKLSLNKISNMILGEQYDDIKAYTAGHLNESHLYNPNQVKYHRPWKTALKSKIDPNKYDSDKESLFNKKEFQLSFSNQSSTYFLTQRKKSPATSSLSNSTTSKLDGDFLRLPSLVNNNNNKLDDKLRPQSHLLQSELLNSDTKTDAAYLYVTDKEIALSYLNGPFNGGSKEEKFKNFVKFEKNVVQKNDINTTNILHSTTGINQLEKKLEQELAKLEANKSIGCKFQFDVYRLDVFNTIFDQIINDSRLFGPILSKIKTEYDDYLFFLLRNQQKAKQKRNNSITDLAEARIEYAKQATRINTLDNEINSLENMIETLNKKNRQLIEQIHSENEFQDKMSNESKELSRKDLSSASITTDSSSQVKKNLSEQLEKNRLLILTKIEQMNNINQKLKNDYVPVSVINNLHHSIKEVESETNKLIQQNRFLCKEEIAAEKELKRVLYEHDRTEFADENIKFLMKIIKNLDVFLSSNSYSLIDTKLDNLFKDERGTQQNVESPAQLVESNKYDDYFS